MLRPTGRVLCRWAPGVWLGVTLLSSAAACDAAGRMRETSADASMGAASVGAAPPRLALPPTRAMDTHAWLASNSGPNGCPMEILGGGFFMPGGASLYIPAATVHSGWGQDVSLHVVGDAAKPLPERVEVVFFSFLEDKFYRANFALPRDSIARLFKEGFDRVQPPGGRGTYELLVAGVAPGGSVAVWVSGSERQVEVFFGQAEPAELDWHVAFDAPDDVQRRGFVADELAEAAKTDPLVRPMMRQVPVGRWAAYRARYRWHPVFEGVPVPQRIAPLRFLNGERDYLALPLDPAAERAERPAPGALAFTDPQSGRSYQLAFDEEEVHAAFTRAGAGGRAVELVFAATPGGGSALRVLVRSAAASVPLEKTKVDVLGGA